MALKGSEEYYRARGSKDKWALDPSRNDRYLDLIRQQTDRTVGQLADQGALRAEGEKNAWGGIGDLGGKVYDGYQQGQDRNRAEEDRQQRRELNKSTIEGNKVSTAGMSEENQRKKDDYAHENAPGPNAKQVAGPPNADGSMPRQGPSRRDVKEAMELRKGESDITTAEVTNAHNRALTGQIGKMSPGEAWARQQDLRTREMAEVGSLLDGAERAEATGDAPGAQKMRLQASKNGISPEGLAARSSEAKAHYASGKAASAAGARVADASNSGFGDATKDLADAEADTKALNEIVSQAKLYNATHLGSAENSTALKRISDALPAGDRGRLDLVSLDSKGIGVTAGREDKIKELIDEKRALLEKRLVQLKDSITTQNMTTLQPRVDAIQNALNGINKDIGYNPSDRSPGWFKRSQQQKLQLKNKSPMIQNAAAGQGAVDNDAFK